MSLSNFRTFLRSLSVHGSQRRRSVALRTGENLEPRLLLTVSPQEQLFLELINRARAEPAAEAARFGINLNEGLPANTISNTARQPLAINDSLQTAIQGHLQDMIDHDFFSHTGTGSTTSSQRMQSAGYTGYLIVGENIAYKATSATPNVTQFVIDQHRALFVDAGISGRGHRLNILEEDFRETGSGVRTGVFNGLNAVFTGNDFGARPGNAFLTGVVYTDTITPDSFYTVGEQLGGVTVAVTGTGGSFNTTSNAAGGYRIALPAGSYSVTFSGPGLTQPVTKSFSIGSQNVKVDAIARLDVDSGPAIAFAATTTTTNESAGTVTVTVNLSRAAATAVTVGYATSSGTAKSGSDFTSASGRLTFNPGQTSASIVIPITDDTAMEPVEQFTVSLSAPVGGVLGSQTTTTVSIADNDLPQIRFERNSLSVSERTTTAKFKLLMSTAYTQPVTVSYTVQSGSATAGSDFIAASGTVTIAPRRTSQYLMFKVINDRSDEDNETVNIQLTGAVNATLAETSATYTILDDDPGPSAKFDFRLPTGAATTRLTVDEGAGTVQVPILLSAPSSRPVVLNVESSSRSTATHGLDFSLPPGVVTFAPGEVRKIVTMNLTDDDIDEKNETIQLAITAVSGSSSTISRGASGMLTIADNDPPPSVSFTTAAASANESTANPGLIIVRLSAASTQKVSVRFTVNRTGTTASTSDFVLRSGTLTFLPGETQKTIPLVIRNDSIHEDPEQISISLSSPRYAVLGGLLSHLFTINDDDPA
ncbi:MAG: hypothetical protein KDA81_12720 [Planctomycetaceae bacterium]|nr:hypothetical protein [Planctomycetaceae bacterium]